MLDRETLGHLMGVVAIWMTNGNNPVDGGNDTRYDFFPGGWCEAAEATDKLVQAGYLEYVVNADDFNVVPTAKGVYEAWR